MIFSSKLKSKKRECSLVGGRFGIEAFNQEFWPTIHRFHMKTIRMASRRILIFGISEGELRFLSRLNLEDSSRPAWKPIQFWGLPLWTRLGSTWNLQRRLDWQCLSSNCIGCRCVARPVNVLPDRSTYRHVGRCVAVSVEKFVEAKRKVRANWVRRLNITWKRVKLSEQYSAFNLLQTTALLEPLLGVAEIVVGSL